MHNPYISKKYSKYLPLEQFHVIELRDLSVKGLKDAAKLAKKDRENIKLTTCQNALTKSLGIKGGMAGYQKAYNDQIIPFLKRNGLRKKADLFFLRKDGLTTLPQLTPQTLSERLFYSGQSCPKKVFTGYDFDYTNTLDDGIYYLNSGMVFRGGIPHGLVAISGDSEPAILNNINIARKNPSIIIPPPERSSYTSRSLLDFVLGGLLRQIQPCFNYLGDSLFYPTNNEVIPETYYPLNNEDQRGKEKALYKEVMALFHERISSSDEGWLDIIPFNENLIFLKGRNGEYDFVFKNQRDKPFEHQIFGNSLKRADVPSCITDYRFERWEYFEYKGFRARDSHDSENLYYIKGGQVFNYPGRDQLLLDFHIDKGHYSLKNIKHSEMLPNFTAVALNGKTLMISDPVSIADFDHFLASDQQYANYRNGDNYSAVNSDPDKSLPASVTWFDALAFINAFEKKTKVSVRLLSYEEYLPLRGSKIPEETESTKINEYANKYREDVEFIDATGNSEAFPEYMHPTDFDKLPFRFSKPIKYLETSSNIKFVNSIDFGEWLMEKTMIRSGNLKSFNGDQYVLRSAPPLISTGKYKGVKTGFRLCYELEQH